MLSHLYNPNTDNPTFDDLIKTGIVLDEKGTINVINPETIPPSIIHISQVASGRGLYRGWISNLQKCIRRGQAREACKSAYECGIMDGPFLSNVINRVCKVIVSEDIGCCNLFLPSKVANFLDELNTLKTPTEKLDKLFEIIVDMCNSNKTRIADLSLHLQRKMNCFKAIQYENFEQAFDECKKFMSMKELLGSVHALEYCMDYGREIMSKNDKITNEFMLPSKSQHYMKTKIYKVWDMLCSIEVCKRPEILNANVALFKIWISNKGSETILNLIHAVCNIVYADQLDFQVRNLHKEEKYTCEMLEKCNDVWIQSAAYDKHVSRWKHPERNSTAFFYLYGSKIDCTLPSIYKIENEMFNAMLRFV